jgi:hypothetical protein
MANPADAPPEISPAAVVCPSVAVVPLAHRVKAVDGAKHGAGHGVRWCQHSGCHEEHALAHCRRQDHQQQDSECRPFQQASQVATQVTAQKYAELSLVSLASDRLLKILPTEVDKTFLSMANAAVAPPEISPEAVVCPSAAAAPLAHRVTAVNGATTGTGDGARRCGRGRRHGVCGVLPSARSLTARQRDRLHPQASQQCALQQALGTFVLHTQKHSSSRVTDGGRNES